MIIGNTFETFARLQSFVDHLVLFTVSYLATGTFIKAQTSDLHVVQVDHRWSIWNFWWSTEFHKSLVKRSLTYILYAIQLRIIVHKVSA